MDANLDVLKRDLEATRERFGDYRAENKRNAGAASVLGAALAAATTASIGLGATLPDLETAFQVCALILSAITAVLSAWVGFNNHKERWLLQSAVIEEIRDIESDIEHREASSTLDQAAINASLERYRAALKAMTTQWHKMQARED